MLFFVPPEHQPRVLAELDTLVHVPFAFETGGAQPIYYDAPEVAPMRGAQTALACSA